MTAVRVWVERCQHAFSQLSAVCELEDPASQVLVAFVNLQERRKKFVDHPKMTFRRRPLQLQVCGLPPQ